MATSYPYYSATPHVAQGNSNVGGGPGDHPNHPCNPYPSPTSTTYTPTVPTLVTLEQHQYGHVVPGHVVEFGTRNGVPIDILRALKDDLGDLENKNEPAFPSYMDVKAKASIRIQIHDVGSYTRQFMSLRSNKEATSISRGKLAQTIAKEVKKMMRGDILRVPGVGDFSMEEIYLTKIGVHPALQVASSWYPTTKEESEPNDHRPSAWHKVNICELSVALGLY